jgi:exosortase
MADGGGGIGFRGGKTLTLGLSHGERGPSDNHAMMRNMSEDGKNGEPSLTQRVAMLPLATKAMFLLLAAGIVVMYAPTMVRLVEIWDQDPDYSHGFLVIPASLIFSWMAWRRAKERKVALTTDDRGVIGGVIGILIGVALHWVGWMFDVLLVDVLSLVCVIRGTIKLVAGEKINEVFAFPALFLLFMAPLPPIVHQEIALFMQQLVATLATVFLDFCGVPVYRQGYSINLPDGFVMEVGQACSGLRSMFAVVALGAALGFVMEPPRWQRWFLFLVALPVAGFTNFVRVVLTGFILMGLGKKYAQGVYHENLGLVMTLCAAVILMFISWCLTKLTTAEGVSNSPGKLAPEKGAPA